MEEEILILLVLSTWTVTSWWSWRNFAGLMAPLHPQLFHFLPCASCIPRYQHSDSKSIASCLTNPRLVNARDGVGDAADAVFWYSEARGSERGSGVASRAA